MNCNKEDIKNSILFFANKYNLYKNYSYLVKNEAIPTVINLIINEMFINEFDYRHCSDEEYNNYKLILNYSQELKNNGFVDFK